MRGGKTQEKGGCRIKEERIEITEEETGGQAS